ncbi:MAG TPA: peroxidase-related enzyme [Stellaceae bacterium]|nr:peroxidase-related enzyme [Stellaceae bacterium]
MRLNADLSQRCVIDTRTAPWVPSPQPGVERKMLDRDGDEVARATSLVRYAPGSRFPTHTHGAGEEFFVLEGVFADERGLYPAGTYVRNPPGSSHAPSTGQGCCIFVKLRQFDPQDLTRVVIDTGTAGGWENTADPGIVRLPLHRFGSEWVRLERWSPGSTRPPRRRRGGDEVFVLSGDWSDSSGSHGEGAWIRDPDAGAAAASTRAGCLLLVKSGHLPAAARSDAMDDHDPISRFPVPALESLPMDMRERIEAVAEKAGFIPNVFLALAHRPDEFRAFFAYHDALMDKPGGLSKAEREMIVVATSSVNQCHYCVIAHGAVLRVRAKDALVADQVAVNYRNARISPRQRAMLDFALKVTQQSYAVGEPDFAVLRGHGFGDEDVWDIAAIAAFFGMSNRLANTLDMRPNAEFYAMGRAPDAGRANSR